jgi:hypothetical protein
MQGEYRGDFTRDTFKPDRHFLRVLQQQGRVWLDADFNEQTSILLHYLQALAADLIGPHGGRDYGFLVAVDAKDVGLTDWKTLRLNLQSGDFVIGKGHYYVDGILCENEGYVLYSLKNLPGAGQLTSGKATPYLIYLDVWERHITYIEDEDKDRNDPSIREVALLGPDTATRSKVVWQVKMTTVTPGTQQVDSRGVRAPTEGWPKRVESIWGTITETWQPSNRGRLKARAKTNSDENTDPCITSPDARYRGAENQLYRVEIHNGGVKWDGKIDEDGSPSGNVKEAATFKWSRENGSVTFRIVAKPTTGDNGNTTTVTLENLGRDQRFGLAEGDWVEIVDDDYTLQTRAESLLQVKSIDRDQMTVTLDGTPESKVGAEPTKHPLLRRWDQKKSDPTKGWPTLQAGVALVQESTGTDGWLTLEDGVQIQFQTGGNYRTGDYWLIPARTATGDVEWPGPVSNPDALPPHGVEHHYAPLAIISVGADGAVTPTDVRRKFSELAQ